MPKETDCSCSCGHNISPEMLAILNAVRAGWGAPLLVSSGARCQKKQDQLIEAGLSKAKRSLHISGFAVDLVPFDKARLHEFQAWVENNAEQYGIFFEDFRFTPSWVHVQCKPFGSWIPGKPRKFKP